MIGYITTKNIYYPDLKDYKIKSFNKLHKNKGDFIFIVEKNKVLYSKSNIDDIVVGACNYGHVEVLEWYKKSKYNLIFYDYYFEFIVYYTHLKILDWIFNYKYKINYYKILNYFREKISFENYKISFENYKILKWMFRHLNNKKMITKIYKKVKNIKIFKFKHRNKYIRGYKKN